MDTKNFEAVKEYTQAAYEGIARNPEGTIGEIYQTLINGGVPEQEARMRTLAFLLREAQNGRNYHGFSNWGESTWG